MQGETAADFIAKEMVQEFINFTFSFQNQI